MLQIDASNYHIHPLKHLNIHKKITTKLYVSGDINIRN